MASSKEIREFLKETNYTVEDMDRFWAEGCEVNRNCQIIQKSGKSWRSLHINVIKELPTIKETTLAELKEKEEAEKAEALKKQQEEEARKYYYDHFDEIMVEKIDKGEELTEKELRDMVFTCKQIYEESGENRRWTRSKMTIVELCERYFRVDWEEGLTECQEDEFYEQPVEVVKHTYQKTITVTEWKEVDKND